MLVLQRNIIQNFQNIVPACYLFLYEKLFLSISFRFSALIIITNSYAFIFNFILPKPLEENPPKVVKPSSILSNIWYINLTCHRKKFFKYILHSKRRILYVFKIEKSTLLLAPVILSMATAVLFPVLTSPTG